MASQPERADAHDDGLGPLLRASAAELVRRRLGVTRIRGLRDREPGFDLAVWREMAVAGWHRAVLPVEAGGLGLGFADLAAISEEIGRGLMPEPFAAFGVLTGAILAASDNPAARTRLLPDLVEGRILATVAWQDGSEQCDPGGTGMIALAQDGSHCLRGMRFYIPAAAAADAFVVSAALDGGIGLFWVPRGAPGMSLRTVPAVDGGSIGTLECRDVAVATEDMIASPAVGADILAQALDAARLAASAELLGIGRGAFDMTLAYAKQREQFGRPIGSFQSLQHRLVDLWIQLQLAASSVGSAAATFDSSGNRARAAAAAKARCSHAAELVTRQSIQLHGGIGYADECDIGLFLKRATVMSAWLGNTRQQRRRLIGMTDAQGR